MEQIARESIYSQPASHIPRPSLLLLIVVSMVVGLAAVSISVRLVAQFPPLPSNPFRDYVDIFPGQPARTIDTRAFSCEAIYNYNHDLTKDTEPMQAICTFIPSEGVFSRIEATHSGSIIYQLTFFMRADTLRVGDLEIFLEAPPKLSFDRTAYFFLPENFVIARTLKYPGRFSRFVRVWSVSFTR